MTPNSIAQRIYTNKAMQANTDAEMLGVIRTAMISGMEQGRLEKEREVQNALVALGLGDLAFKSEHDLT